MTALSRFMLRKGSAAEEAAAAPAFTTLPRLERPPVVYFGGIPGEEPAFALGILPESRIRYGGRDYFLEMLRLKDQSPEPLKAALETLARDLRAGHFVTNYVRDGGGDAAFLQEAGFAPVAWHEEMTLAREAVEPRLAQAARQLARWQGRGVEIRPLTGAPAPEVGRLIASAVGIVPDGIYVLSGELPSKADYSFSLAAMTADGCCGALVAGLQGERLTVETVVVAESHQGTPVAGMLLLALMEKLAGTAARVATFRIAGDNRGSLMLAQRLGARPVGRWLRLAWPRPDDAPEIPAETADE
jgi:hypothetical protein